MSQYHISINIILKILRNISIKSPKKSEVIIYDNAGSEVIKKYILTDLNYTILYTRLEKFYLSPNIILKIAKNICTRKLLGGGFFSKLYRAYLISCIEYVNPKIVITTIDNDILFYIISNYFLDIRFYAIQNGMRFPIEVYDQKKALLEYGDSHNNSLYNVILMCFGDKDRRYFINTNFCLKEIFPVGSLKESVYQDFFQRSTDKKDIYDICLISQYHRGMATYPEIMSGLNRLNVLLKKLIDDIGYKLCIALRSNEMDEMKYFKNFFGDSISFTAQCQELFSTYSAMDSSKLIVTFFSTAGFEAIGLGKKVLFCGPKGFESYLFGNFKMPLLFVSNEDYQLFKDIVMYLIKMDNYAYFAELHDVKSYLMNNDDVPLYRSLRITIKNAITE